MATVAAKPATLDDFLIAEAEAPEGMRLALIDGEIVEWGTNITTRGPAHTRVMSLLTFFLWLWARQNRHLRAYIDCGEVRCRLSREIDEIVGIDLGVWCGAEFAKPPTKPPLYDAPPLLAVEILSPADTHERVIEKVRLYLSRGVERVWLIDAELQTVTVSRSDKPPTTFNIHHVLTDEETLPGLELPIRELFDSEAAARE